MSFSLGGYASEVQVTAVRAGPIGVLVAAGWITLPFILASLLHPSDVINLHYVLQGEAPHKILTGQQMVVGFVEAVLALAVLLPLQFLGIVLVYRRGGIQGAAVATPALWPVVVVLGVIGNAAWLVFTREFDVAGFVFGMAPMAITFIAERLLEHFGRDFVMGARAGLH